ncbi:MAG: hypothetical protein K8T26_18305 [Lentisphaerae bacterium]|nr:hypothetical protein [Lentisphaerota bacterium]
MKRGLRQAHRYIFLVLLLILPLLYVAALCARRAPAVMERVPAELTSGMAPASP